MSGPLSLPPDVDRWASDPYELLGLSHGTAPDEVRAAYDRLASAFDPAGAPEPCRRLRAARDAVLRDLELMQILEAPLTLELRPEAEPVPPRHEAPAPDDFDLSEALRAAVPPEAAAAGVPPDAIAPTLLPPRRDPAVGLWQMALSGDEAEAYRGLVGLLERDGPTEEVCLRLYWLLTARPDLDRERAPLDWLARGLGAVGLSGPLWELYRRALADDPNEALSPRCGRLFGAPAEPDGLVELALSRWPAAGRAQRWDVMTADLEALRERMPRSAWAAWARVWAGALDQLVWSDAKPARGLAASCFESISEIPSDAPPVTEARKRVNIVRDLAAAWRKLRPEPEVPPPLLALVPPSWSRPFPEVRPQLLAFLADALRSPRSLLRALDATHEQPAVLAQFARLLERLQETLPPPPLEARSSRDLTDLALAFLDTADRSYYRNFRPALLDFCLREAIAPEAVAELIEENPHYWLSPDRHLSEAVRADEPLRLAGLAHRLFWT
jgi:hypothetical protein